MKVEAVIYFVCGREYLLTFVGVLICTAYSTLLERKLLAGAQRRKGPNKVRWKGAVQPLTDALKLFLKQEVIPARARTFLFLYSPCLALRVSLGLWVVWPQLGWCAYPFSFSVLLYLLISSIHIYGVVLAGWSSNSMYAILGTIRAVSQTISYELPLTCVVLGICYQIKSYTFGDFFGGENPVVFFVLDFPIFIIWICLVVAELHRAPFDLPEAESELVSGYNTDYGAVGFILLFVSEYANLVFAGQITRVFWFHGLFWVGKVVVGILLRSFILFIRAVLPRIYYRGLMEVC